MKIYFLTFVSLCLSSCVTVSGSYSVSAYDKDGMKLTDNMELIADGSGIYSIRNALCASHPGSIVKIIDLKTNQELKPESPYQCTGKAPTINHPTNFPKHLNLFNTRYTLAYKKTTETGALYEYTSNHEPIDHWTSLVTLLYNKDLKISPKEWLQVSHAQSVKPFYNAIENGHGYTQTIFKPSKQYRYFEAVVKKTWHVKSCNGLVTYSYAKKHSTSAQLETIINESKAALSTLRSDSWFPICKHL